MLRDYIITVLLSLRGVEDDEAIPLFRLLRGVYTELVERARNDKVLVVTIKRMARSLPFVFLFSVASLFGLAWIVIQIDPDSAAWYFFALFVLLLLVSVWGLLGLVLYFVRTRFYRRYNPDWYFKTSFKMAFFVALFIAVAAILAILELVTVLNVVLTIVALALFAIWSYLGKKN